MRSIFSSVDYFLLIPALLIVFISFFVLSSFQPDLAQSQALYSGIGLLIFFFLRYIHPYDLRTFAYYGYGLILIALIAVFFIGEISRGSNRWIPIWGDLRIQPSEFAKPMLVLSLGALLSTYRYFNAHFFLKSFGLVALYFMLVFLQPDLGTALVFLAVWASALFIADISWKKGLTLIIVTVGVALLAGPVAWHGLHTYQQERILTFLNPNRDPLGRGYNAMQAIITVGSGGLYGKGLGQGTQSHNNFLPEQYTDFAFATFSEEFGFVGILILFSLYGVILWRIFTLSGRVESRFVYSICMGIAAILFFQILVNVGMNSGLLPITGITLPFFSYGGSSVISFFICLGMVQAVSTQAGRSSEV
jgi:rod shape determining protein RodA